MYQMIFLGGHSILKYNWRCIYVLTHPIFKYGITLESIGQRLQDCDRTLQWCLQARSNTEENYIFQLSRYNFKKNNANCVESNLKHLFPKFSDDSISNFYINTRTPQLLSLPYVVIIHIPRNWGQWFAYCVGVFVTNRYLHSIMHSIEWQ